MRIGDRLNSNPDSRGRIIEEMVLLSAMTGVDFSYILNRQGGIHVLDTCALLEDFLEQAEPNALIPGQRYFLGHLIPD